MENRFRLADHGTEARLARLPEAQAQALEQALARIAGPGPQRPRPTDRDGWPHFLLPLAEFGLSLEQILALADKLPPDYPLDHSEIYFDFRLGKWLRHLEPPTLAECLEEYLQSAETPAQGLAYLKRQWEDFLRRRETG